MFCARCGTPCAENAVFCAHCGAALQAEGGMVSEPPGGPPQAPPPAPVFSQEPSFTSPQAARRALRPRRPFRRLSHRTGEALTAGVLILLVLLLALTPRGTGGPEIGPPRSAGLYGANAEFMDGQYIYYDGALVAGPEEGLILYQDLGLDGALLTDYQDYYYLDADGLTPLPEVASSEWALGEDCMWYINDEGLWQLSYDGSQPALMDAAATDAAGPVCSPSGDAVVYAAYGGQDELELRLCRSGGRVYTVSPWGGVPVAVSDGGRYVYYLPGGDASTGGNDLTQAMDEQANLLLWDGDDIRPAAFGQLYASFFNWDGTQAAICTEAGAFLVEGNQVFYQPEMLLPLSYAALSTGWDELVRTMGDYCYYLNVEDLTGSLFLHYQSDGSLSLDRWNGGDHMEELVWVWSSVAQDNSYRLTPAGDAGAWYTQDDGIYYLDRQGRAERILESDRPADKLYFIAASPEGECLLYGDSETMFFLTRDGTQRTLSGTGRWYNLWTCFYGVYYWDESGLFFVSWDGGEPRAFDLGAVRSSQGTSAGLMVTAAGADGLEHIWHILPGRDPIQIS